MKANLKMLALCLAALALAGCTTPPRGEGPRAASRATTDPPAPVAATSCDDVFPAFLDDDFARDGRISRDRIAELRPTAEALAAAGALVCAWSPPNWGTRELVVAQLEVGEAVAQGWLERVRSEGWTPVEDLPLGVLGRYTLDADTGEILAEDYLVLTDGVLTYSTSRIGVQQSTAVVDALLRGI